MSVKPPEKPSGKSDDFSRFEMASDYFSKKSHACRRGGFVERPRRNASGAVKKYPPAFRWVCWAVCLIFLFEQTVFSEPGAANIDALLGVSAQPVQSAEGAVPAQTRNPVAVNASLPSASEFLQDAGALTSATEDRIESQKILTAPDPVKGKSPYEAERYDFEDAFDQLRPEYATAMILKSLSGEDLERLAGLSFEAGILVLDAEIVLFTSGSADEIGILPAAKQLAGQASLISHIHPGPDAGEGPSGIDLYEAAETSAEEYVLTQNGVYVYGPDGILNDGNPYSYEWYLEKIQAALDASMEDRQSEARAELNRFIQDQDAYNQASEEQKQTFRMGGQISPATKGTVSTLPGSPYPYLMTGSTGSPTLKLNTPSTGLNLGYSFTSATTDKAGVTMSFDNPNTSGTEMFDLTTLGSSVKWVFGIKGTSQITQLTLEVVDAANAKDTWYLNTIGTTEKFWTLDPGKITGINRKQVTKINLIVTQPKVPAANRTGTLTVRVNGLKTSAPAAPVISSAVPAATNQTSLTLTGTKDAYASVSIGGSVAVPANSSTTWTATVNLAEGSNGLNVTQTSAIGLVSPVKSLTIVRDTAKPSGSININSGALYTSLATVNLNLSASDVGTGIDKMSFSTDNVTWGAAEAYASSKSWPFSGSDGSKAVYVKYFDKAGNVSAVYSKSIILDRAKPAGSFTINNGASSTANRNVMLNLSGITDSTSGLLEISYAINKWEDALFSPWEPFVSTKSVLLADWDGVNWVGLKVRDKAGNEAGFTNFILLDRAAPAGNFTINGGAQNTNDRSVVLNLAGIVDSGSGPKEICYMFNGWDDAKFSVWEPYQASKTVVIPSWEGQEWVALKVRDDAGNVGGFVGSIVYDRTPPSGSFKIKGGATSTSSVNVTLDLTGFSDAVSGLGDISYAVDNGAFSAWQAYSGEKNIVIPQVAGAHTISLRIRDKAQNVLTVSGTVNYVPDTGIVFSSPATAANSSYTLTYRYQSVDYTEIWNLRPGENRLLVRIPVSGGSGFIYGKHTVTFTQSDPGLPSMPAVPGFPGDLVDMKTQDGLILQYQGGTLWAVENPGVYRMYLPELDPAGNLTGGLIVFENGDRLLYKNSKAVYRLNSDGQKLVYDSNGRVTALISAAGSKTGFDYRTDAAGNVLSILSLEDSVTSLYDAAGVPVWILKKDGTDIRYENGRLKEYRDAAGNIFYFTSTPLQSGGVPAGYRTEISSVYAAGPAKTVALAEVLVNPALYASVIASLNLNVPKTIEYGAAGQMQKAVSGAGEILQFSQGLPVSLTDVSGQKINFNVDAAGGISVSSGGPGQVYDDSGVLTGIKLSDGTILSMDQLKLDQIELGGGGLIKGISWTGSVLTGFTHVYPDGSEETYENGLRKSRTDTEGNRTTYIFYGGAERVDRIVTKDGRTYQIIESTNADGLTDRISNLRQIDLPDGSKIVFEPGKAVQYIQNKQVTLDVTEVPELPSGQAYLSSMTFSHLELRGVTIDASGNILAGEILFYDGTQYFIRDGRLLKQITPSGQVVEFGAEFTPVIPPLAPIMAAPLTAAETAFRNQLVESQLDYFVSGVGLDPLTGLPVDNYSQTQGVSNYSQATLVGFWAEILATIARGDYVTSKMSRQQALERLGELLKTYGDVQMQAGWNGLVSFFTISFVEQDVLDPLGKPTGQKVKVPVYKRKVNEKYHAEEVGLGDVLNLAVSLSSVIGALSNFSYGSLGLDTTRAGIVASAQAILAAQDKGYPYFYDSSSGRFRMVVRIFTNRSYAFDGYMDRVFNEFRTGMFWLAARNPVYRSAIQHLDVAIRPYETESGDTIDNAVPFDGGAFQMFWPLIHMDETKYPEFDTVLRNFMYSQADYASKTGNPGLLSAGDQPGAGYAGKIGIPAAAETDDPLLTGIGSLYGTASAFGIAPHYTLQFLKNLLTSFPGIRTSAGFVDSLTVRTVTNVDPVSGKTVTTKVPMLSSQYFGVDQASMILSLLKTSQTYFSDYLAQSGTAAAVDAIYQGFSFGLNPADSPNPAAPSFNVNVPLLYDGTDPNPDKSGPALIKQAGLIPSLSDPEFGTGEIYHYLTPDGRFHHSEIEFENGSNIRKMSLQEFLLLPGRSDAARSLFEILSFDLLGDSQAMGGFYSEGAGFADCSLRVGSELGDIRKFRFDFRDIAKPVGLWADYPNLDLSQYDYISIPIRLDEETPEGLRLKFEFKGIGEIYVSPSLTDEWQYVQIPILRSSGKLTQIAITIQSPDGKPAAGTVLLGPLAAFKVRTSNNINWMGLTGKSVSEMQTLLKQQALQQPGSGGQVTRQEVLENFVLDSDGKLVSGTLRHADGSIQYFKNGRLSKWIFPNGRTVLFSDGLASFILDLSRGQLTESRYYYDQTFRGEITSMVVQDNDRKRIYDRDGNLQQIIENGRFTYFKDGQIDRIVTDTATLSHLVFGDDGSLLMADGLTVDGHAFTIDMTQEQEITRSNGVKVYYKDNRVTAVYTPQNGRTELTYRYDANKKLFGIDVSFKEMITDPVSKLPVEVGRTESLFDYIYRADRQLEIAEIVQTTSNQLAYGVGAYTFPYSIPETPKVSYGSGCGNGSSVCAEYAYNNTGVISGVVIGKDKPVSAGAYDFLLLRLMQGPSMTWPQDFNLFLKDVRYQVLNPVWSVENVPGSGYKTFVYNLAGLAGDANEISLELVKESAGVGKTGNLYFQDVSYVALKKYRYPLWEDAAGIAASEIQNLRNEGEMLMAVGAQIASGKPRVYDGLKSILDIPTQIVYHETSSDAKTSASVVSFRQFDGSSVDLEGDAVRRVVLPDGTVNEYSASENAAQTSVTGAESPAGANQTPEGGQLNYRYGALRKVTQADGKIYELSYEFCGQGASAGFCGPDETGKQITVIKDDLTGDIRRFKDGKLLQSASAAGVSTNYEYENGELIGSELLYKNRVLNSASYRFSGEETQVTDDDGTTWYYDANGNLKKHLTRDGYLYSYSDYSATLLPLPPGAGEGWGEGDYKRNNVFNASGLRSVTLAGYEAQDGTQIKQAGEAGLFEIDFPSGDKAVNVVLDGDRKIKSGQIQFANGLIVVIDNYLPISGRLADKTVFSVPFPQGSTDTRIVQDEAGAYTGSLLKINGKYYGYDAYGYLKKIETTTGDSYQFTYQTDVSGKLASYDVLRRGQLAFDGIPFPKELSFSVTDNLTLKGPDGVILEKSGGSGFLIAAYDDSANTWKSLAGQLASDGDRILLKNFLKNLKTGQYAAVMVSDPNFSKMDEETLTLLEGIGAGNVRQARASGQNWYLFGNEFLDQGKGCEKSGGTSFSTVTEDTTHVNITGIANPVFESVPVVLNIPKPAADAHSVFLKAYEKNKLSGELQAVAVYNTKDEIVYSEQLDGTRTFYDKGKPRETYTRTGELLYTQEYGCPSGGCPAGTDPYLSKVTLVKARQDFETQVLKSREQIARVEFDALLELAEQHAVAVATIEQEVNNAVAALDAQIRQLEAARYQTVKECKKILFWKVCSSRTFEVPGVKDQIDQLSAQKAELLSKIKPEQIESVPGLIAAKKIEIQNATAEKKAELARQEQSVFHDILQREFAPVLSDIYRRLLGRDPSSDELEAEITRAGSGGVLDFSRTVSEIKNSLELQKRAADKAAILGRVRTFLAAYVPAAGDSAKRTQLAQSLKLELPETVALAQEEVNSIMAWLEGRDLHFGQSAFLSLKTLLSSRGIDVDLVTLGAESILIDILTGTINKFAEGDLLLSVFALGRAAKIHGADITGVAYTLDDFKAVYTSSCPQSSSLSPQPCSLRVIAHVGGNHYVVITSMTADSVTFLEPNKGAEGGLVTETFDQFKQSWNPAGGTGYLVMFRDKALASKTVSDETAKKIRGAFFGIDLIFWFTVASIVLTVASVAVSFISPALGKILGYAAMVAGIVAIAASVVNFVVAGFQAMLKAVTSFQNLTLLQSIQQGFSMLGNAIWSGVSHIGDWIRGGFNFVKGVFTGGFGSLSAGITSMKKFVVDGIQLLKNPAGGLIQQNLTFGQVVARNMIAAAINLPVSKGLEGLGIDSTMARLAGAFVSGGLVGLGGGAAGFFKSGAQMYLLQGVSEMGMHLNLPPPITQAVSLAVTSSLTSYFDPSFNLKTYLPQIFKNFSQQLTMGGVELIGRSMGMKPWLTKLIGVPAAAAVGGIVGTLMNPSSGVSSLWQTIKNAVLSSQTVGGMVSVGAGIALDAIGASPMLQNLISGLLNCAVNNLGPDTSSIGASLFKQIGDNISKFGHKLIDLAGNVVSFAAKVMQGVGYLTKAGFAKAVDFFSSMFDHKTIEDLTQNGTVSIESALSDHCSTIIDGIHCAYKTVQIDYSVSNDSFSYSNTGVAGEFQALRTDQTSFEGNISISEDLPDGIKLDERFVGGQAVNVNVVDPQKLQFRIVRLNPGEEILPVTMTNEGLFYNVPIRGTNHYFSFTGNGFWNDGIPDKTGIAALSKQFIQDTIQDKLSAGEVPIPLLDSSGRPAVDREGYILTANSLPLTLYDDTANVAINAIVWGKEFLGGHPLSGRLEQELRSYFNLIEYNKQHYGLQADQLQYTYFAHSGNFMPLLKVLDSNPDMPIQTIISYEGPDLLDRTIHNSHLERIIQVKGTQGNLDYDLSGLAVSGMTGGAEVKDFGPPFLDFRDYRGIDASGTVRDIQNIHIEILGARHNDFDYHPDDPDPVFREISRKTNLFMRDLSLISNSNSQLKDFLEITPGISFDSNRKVYVVDPGKYESFRERN